LKILIVEDNVSVRRLIASIIQPIAEEIRECEDGAGAAAAYQAQKPDFVLMDIRMPEVDGIAATKQIRILDPAARIVIVTDYDDSQLRDAALAAGACDYTLKDNLPDLVSRLRRLRANPGARESTSN
jgi:CheY-like chemotaxis protein